jgi:hypothetical protein
MWLLMHNGILNGYIQAREELVKKGHNFKGDTDSEVVIHMLEEVKDPAKLIPAMKEAGIGGQANLIIMGHDATYAISDGSLTLIKFKHGNIAVASDDMPWMSKRGQHVNSGKMLIIPADVTQPIVEMEVGALPSGYAFYMATGYEGYEGGAEWSNRGTGTHWVRRGTGAWRRKDDGSFQSAYNLDNEERREMSDIVQSREAAEMNEDAWGAENPQWADKEEERLERAIASWEEKRIRQLRQEEEREEFEKVATGLEKLFGTGGYCKNCDITWEDDAAIKNNACPTCRAELYTVRRE